MITFFFLSKRPHAILAAQLFEHNNNNIVRNVPVNTNYYNCGNIVTIIHYSRHELSEFKSFISTSKTLYEYAQNNHTFHLLRRNAGEDLVRVLSINILILKISVWHLMIGLYFHC